MRYETQKSNFQNDKISREKMPTFAAIPPLVLTNLKRTILALGWVLDLTSWIQNLPMKLDFLLTEAGEAIFPSKLKQIKIWELVMRKIREANCFEYFG